MRDRGWIYSGLGLFLILVTYPFWQNLRAGVTSKGPDLRRPAEAKQCVMPVSYMRTSHMDLLASWRENAVRDGVRTFQSADGQTYNVSLSGTCITQCHASKEEFCDRCHNYASVSNYCWDCHVDPRQAHGSAR
ncbi:MAG: sulfate reduction electron transfer complex DsrMKJOP subunit DsrJ [Bryobacteraceae bacterium]|nr:sulfate reduction electron transfer complex DsrMKJOP subunit DsrJ [Bryobacteraceae bacterium]